MLFYQNWRQTSRLHSSRFRFLSEPRSDVADLVTWVRALLIIFPPEFLLLLVARVHLIILGSLWEELNWQPNPFSGWYCQTLSRPYLFSFDRTVVGPCFHFHHPSLSDSVDQVSGSLCWGNRFSFEVYRWRFHSILACTSSWVFQAAGLAGTCREGAISHRHVP